MSTSHDQVVVTPAEAAELLRCTRSTIYNLLRRGELRRYHVGRHVRIKRVDVLSLVGLADDEPES